MKLPTFSRPVSIAGRLLAFSGIFVTLALAVTSVVLWLALKTVVREQIDQRLDTQIGALASTVQREPGGGFSLSSTPNAPPFDRPLSGWYWRIDGDNQHIGSLSLGQTTLDAPPVRRDLRRMLTGMPVSGEARDSDGRAVYLRQAVRIIDGETLTITATAPMAALVDPALKALFWLIPSMLVLGAVLMAGTLWQVRFGLRPLTGMADDIDAINRGEKIRLPDQQTRELHPLAANTNDLLQANEERLIATRMQFANLSHGLKTPVASLMLALDERNDPAGTLRDFVSRIDQRIKHHLGAARRVMASTGIAATTDVARSVANLHLAISMIHADRGIAFTSDVEDGLKVACDESDLEEMLGNLIDNAFKWSSSSVLVTARRDGPTIRITIEDDGRGISPANLAAVLLPGVREDERMPGSGFGLGITSELASLYGGSLCLEPRVPSGLRAVLSLPASVRSMA